MPFSDNNSGSNWNMDYSGQLNEMLAPYQKMAQTLSSPYATMRPDSWLATQHPEAAKMLDSTFLGAAMTPGPSGPEGVGGGISRAFQGMVGAQQYRRQQMIQSAMLPYQMLEPRLKAEDTIAQMQQRGQQAQYERQRGEWYEARIGQMQNPHAQGRSMTDDKGGEWQENFDPATGKSRLFNPISQQFADTLHPADQPSFSKSQRAQRTATPGGLAGEIIDNQMSADPAVAARGKQEAGLYANLYGARAGAGKAGEQNAPHTFDEQKMFMENEFKAAHSQQTPLQNEKQFYQGLDPVQMGEFFKNPNMYKDYVDQHNVQRQQTDQNFSEYEKSGVWKNKIGYQDWVKNPGKYVNSGDNPANAAPNKSAPNPDWKPNPNWTPNK